jgi:hypothetical protein
MIKYITVYFILNLLCKQTQKDKLDKIFKLMPNLESMPCNIYKAFFFIALVVCTCFALALHTKNK